MSYDSDSDYEPEFITNARRGRGKRKGSGRIKGACRGTSGRFVSCDSDYASARENAGHARGKSGKSRKSGKASKGSKARKSRRWGAAAERPYSTSSRRGKSRRSGKATKPWPKKGTSKMGHVVAGVEARVHEDVTKALRILKGAKYRSQATAKRAGARKASSFNVLDKIVHELERMLTR